MAVYCLIFFSKSKTTDVILEKSLLEKKEEGESVLIMYGKERCKGKILKKSTDKAYLDSLVVSKDGTILSALQGQQVLKKIDRKRIKVAETKAKRELNRALIAEKNIFEDNMESKENYPSNGQKTSSTPEDSPTLSRKRIKLSNKKRQEKREIENQKHIEREIEELEKKKIELELRKVEIENERKKIEKQERERKQIEEFERHQLEVNEELHDNYETDLDMFEDDDERPLRLDNTRASSSTGANKSKDESGITDMNDHCNNCVKTQSVVDKAILQMLNIVKDLESMKKESTLSKENLISILPAYKKRRGADELKPKSGLYIDRLDLADASRFLMRPSEMVRRLTLYLVGAENLRNMVPRGNKNKIGIPKEIQRAVFWYVNKYADIAIAAKDFQSVLSNQCSTLRNPKSYERKSVGRNSGKDEQKNETVSDQNVEDDSEEES